MENTTTNYQSKVGSHVPKDVKEYVLKRVRESGKTIKELAHEHGISAKTIYRWISETGGEDGAEVRRLQKENTILKHLVAELSLVVHSTKKKNS